MKAQDVMTPEHLWVCGESTNARDVAQMMSEHNVGAIPVLDDQSRLEGIVTDRDLCCRVIAQGRSPETPVREIMSMSMHSVRPEADLHEVEALMRQYKVRRIPVVDDSNRLQGFISLADLSRHCHGQPEEHELAEVLEAICAPD